ncbi:MAG: replication initiator RepC [Rhodobacteraceae bacterium]|nr:MAG: replication initiator RepC [Paracoccaceae bacterium]
MVFTQLSIRPADSGPRTEPASPPDTDLWAIFRALRDARGLFGLRPGHVQTLQAMLSFLKPGHGETVFASNQAICRRIGGIDERTLRRHIDRFVELGFITRHDSPNRKRYRVRASDGKSLSYGLSLAPLLARGAELLAMAQDLENARRDRLFLRKQILTRLAHLEGAEPENPLPQDTRKALRRKLSVAEYRALLAAAEAECQRLSTAVDAPEAREMPANDGQTVRHHSMSEKEQKDLEGQGETPDLRMLTSVCDQATAFASDRLENWHDVETHAGTLAPMMGIHASSFEKARNRIGPRKTACAIFIMLQLGTRIRDFGAYFHSITLGRKERQFQPTRLLETLARSGGAVA